MTTVFGCIADDFTGATDIAGILTRAGVDVNLRLGVPDSSSLGEDKTAQFEIIALKNRTSPVDEAVEVSLSALHWLKLQGASHFFWKYCSTFDSTAQGNIGPVAEALMHALDVEQTIYCPAFPENGRSIYMGNLFVGDQLLHESPMKDHPLTPMTDSNLVRLLQPQVQKKVDKVILNTVREGASKLRANLDAFKDQQIAHAIIDAVESCDLQTIIDATGHLKLLTGGSALALYLPDYFRRQNLLSNETSIQQIPEIAPGQLVLSGSCSAMTRRQVDTYKDQAHAIKIDPVSLASTPDVLASLQSELAKLPAELPKLIYATNDPASVAKAQETLGSGRAGAIVEDALASLALTAFEHGVRRFVVAGGETSGAVAQRLGINQLSVGSEIAPGVPWTFGRSAGMTVALALKSGNFGDEQFFAKALEQLP